MSFTSLYPVFLFGYNAINLNIGLSDLNYLLSVLFFEPSGEKNFLSLVTSH